MRPIVAGGLPPPKEDEDRAEWHRKHYEAQAQRDAEIDAQEADPTRHPGLELRAGRAPRHISIISSGGRRRRERASALVPPRMFAKASGSHTQATQSHCGQAFLQAQTQTVACRSSKEAALAQEGGRGVTLGSHWHDASTWTESTTPSYRGRTSSRELSALAQTMQQLAVFS